MGNYFECLESIIATYKKATKKYQRYILNNNILSKYNIPLFRLTTNGSREESIIRSKLDEIVNNKQLYNI